MEQQVEQRASRGPVDHREVFDRRPDRPVSGEVRKVAIQAKSRADNALAAEMGWTAGSSLVSIAVAAFFWWFGAGFTIIALKWMFGFFGTPQDSRLWYAVPVLFSVIEMAAWQLKDTMTPRVRKLAQWMTGLDMGSTILGIGLGILVNASAIPFASALGHWVYAVIVVVSVIAGWAVTLYPERLTVDSCMQLWSVGKALLGK